MAAQPQSNQRPGKDENTNSVGKRRLPAWPARLTTRDFKTLFRCVVAIWGSAILMFIQPTLDNFGMTAFFAAIVLFIIPPSNVLLIQLMAAFITLLGMCLGWAWGLLAMKAARAARPDNETQARLAQLGQEAALRASQSGNPVLLEATTLVHNGFMLDTRVTVVFYVMACCFIYALARLRCSYPKFTPLQILGTITMDLFLLYGPSLPSFDASLASSLVKPAAVGMAIGLVCCIFIFPESTSSVVLGKLEVLTRLGGATVAATGRIMNAGTATDSMELEGLRGKLIGAYKALEPSLAFLPIDMSRCYWSTEDVTQVNIHVREVLLASLTLTDFLISTATPSSSLRWSAKGGSTEEILLATKEKHVGHAQLLQMKDAILALRTAEGDPLRERTLLALHHATAEVLTTVESVTSATVNCIRHVNNYRWTREKPGQTHQDLADDLAAKLESFHKARVGAVPAITEAILDEHAHLFDENGAVRLLEDKATDLSGIILSMVLEEGMLQLSTTMDHLASHIVELMKRRKSPRLWLPSRLAYAFNWALDRNNSTQRGDAGTDNYVTSPDLESHAVPSPAAEGQDKEGFAKIQNSGSRVGTRARRSPLSRRIVSLWSWLTSPGGMYSLRMVAVTIALSIPSAIPSSAGFFYREKGLWAVITAQTTLLVYMADVVVSVVIRLLGTIVGGTLALVAWYIGSGSGHGNPYGLAASSFPMIVILMFLRLHPPPLSLTGTILAGATFVLILGFSYDVNHLPEAGLPGKGYATFWRRLVLVQVGLAATLIIQLLPSPPSATKHVRYTIAGVIAGIADQYAIAISSLRRPHQSSKLIAFASFRSFELAGVLFSMNPLLATLTYELSLSKFDRKSLASIQRSCRMLNGHIRRLASMGVSLPENLQERFFKVTGLLDKGSTGRVTALLSVIESSIRTESPLSEGLPTPLLLHFLRSWPSFDGPLLTQDLVRQEGYRRYCVALYSYVDFLSELDTLLLDLKDVLGERHCLRKED